MVTIKDDNNNNNNIINIKILPNYLFLKPNSFCHPGVFIISLYICKDKHSQARNSGSLLSDFHFYYCS